MKTPLKLLLGLIAITPLLISVIFVGPIVYFAFADPEALGRFLLGLNPAVMLLVNVVLLVGSYGPMIFYLVHAARNADLENRRTAWILVLVFVGVFAMPVYWFLFVWRDSYYER